MNNIEEVSNKIINQIKDKIDSNWSLLQKIRFIYLSVASRIETNTDFFLNKKLNNLKLSEEEMNDLYQNDMISVSNKNNEEYYKVICKSGAKLLQNIFDHFNISSKLASTVDSDGKLKHWFLVVKDENEQQYFLTIVPDIVNVRNNLPTEHFASYIGYLNNVTIESSFNDTVYDRFVKKLGEINKKISDVIVANVDDKHYCLLLKEDLPYIKIKNAKEIFPLDNNLSVLNDNNDIHLLNRIYDASDVKTRKVTRVLNELEVEYEEIDFKKLSFDDIKKLDESINVTSLYDFHEKLSDERGYMNLYYTLSEESSEIYKILYDAFSSSNDKYIVIDDINSEQITKFKRNLFSYVTEELNKKYNLNIESLTSKSEDFINQFIKEINIDVYNKDEDIRKKLKSLRKVSNDLEIKETVSMLLSVMSIEDRFDQFIYYKNELEKSSDKLKKQIENYHRLPGVDKDIENRIYTFNKKIYELEGKYEILKKEISAGKINPLLNSLSFYFLKDKIYKENTKSSIPNSYLYNKLLLMFPTIFDCEIDGQTHYDTSFSKQGYNEQVSMIKRMIKTVFSEINEYNCESVYKYNKAYSPIENRIRVYPLKDIETKENHIGIRILSTKNPLDNEINFAYIPSENTLKELNLMDLSNKYIIVSSSLSSRLRELENIEVIDNDENKVK